MHFKKCYYFLENKSTLCYQNSKQISWMETRPVYYKLVILCFLVKFPLQPKFCKVYFLEYYIFSELKICKNWKCEYHSPSLYFYKSFSDIGFCKLHFQGFHIPCGQTGADGYLFKCEAGKRRRGISICPHHWAGFSFQQYIPVCHFIPCNFFVQRRLHTSIKWSAMHSQLILFLKCVEGLSLWSSKSF